MGFIARMEEQLPPTRRWDGCQHIEHKASIIYEQTPEWTLVKRWCLRTLGAVAAVLLKDTGASPEIFLTQLTFAVTCGPLGEGKRSAQSTAVVNSRYLLFSQGKNHLSSFTGVMESALTQGGFPVLS